MNLVAALISAVILSACAAVPTQTYSYADLRAMTKILATEGGNGSGVVIAPGLILTAKHVAENGDQLFVEPGHFPATTLRLDPDNDLALMSVPGVGCPCAELATVDPQIDDFAVLIGYPLNSNITIQILTEGRIQGIASEEKHKMLVSTTSISFGNSGGPLFVNGKLVGIGVQVSGQPPGVPYNIIAFSVSRENIEKFLKR